MMTKITQASELSKEIHDDDLSQEQMTAIVYFNLFEGKTAVDSVCHLIEPEFHGGVFVAIKDYEEHHAPGPLSKYFPQDEQVYLFTCHFEALEEDNTSTSKGSYKLYENSDEVLKAVDALCKQYTDRPVVFHQSTREYAFLLENGWKGHVSANANVLMT